MNTQKIILTALLAVLGLSGSAQQSTKTYTDAPRQNIIKVNFLSPVFGTLMVFYQHNITDDKSFQLGLGYMNFYGFNTYSTEDRDQTGNQSDMQYNFTEESKGIFITPEYRIMLWGDNMKGLFAAPFLRYSYLQYTESYDRDTGIIKSSYGYYGQKSGAPMVAVSDKYQYHSVGIGALLGQQIIFRNKISLEYYAGPVYSILLESSGPRLKGSDLRISEYMNSLMIRGYGIRAGLNVGFLF